MFTFMRALLVRRFESSFGAFERSVEHVIEMHERVKSFAEETGTLLVNRTLMEKVLSTDDDDEREELLQRIIDELRKDERVGHPQVYNLDKQFDREHVFRDLKSDLVLLRYIQKELQSLNLRMHDPKAQKLIRILKSVMEGSCSDIPGKQQRKVLVFSEFADTVDHLQGYLDIAFPDKVLVVNYDIPWNPTRVIQRVGRINRIGQKVFEHLYIFNFFPTEQGADIHRSRQIADEKMFLIHSTIGEDMQILAPDEEPTAAKLFRKVNADAEESEGESFLTKAQRELDKIRRHHPEALERIAQFPPRVKTASGRSPGGVYFFKRRGAALFALRHDGESVAPLTLEDGLDAIRCEPAEPRLDFARSFWPRYEALCHFNRSAENAASGTQGLVNRARNQLLSARDLLPDALRPFVELLLEDIQYYGTLSDRLLRNLAKPDLSAAEGIQEMAALLGALQRELGEDYLSLYKRSTAEEHVIITVEQQGPATGTCSSDADCYAVPVIEGARP